MTAHIIKFPIRANIWLTRRYNEACRLHDKYKDSEIKHDKMMAAMYMNAMITMGDKLDSMGGAA